MFASCISYIPVFMKKDKKIYKEIKEHLKIFGVDKLIDKSIGMMMLSFFFDYGPLPAVATGVIWLVTAISYFREAQKLGREKINNQ